MVSVISPVLNEEPNLGELIRRVHDTLAGYHAIDDWEYLLVDDASTDGSWAVIQDASRQHPGHVRGFRHRSRQGQGGAQRTGFFHARGDIMVTLDADLQLYPEDIPGVLEPIVAGGQDVICTRVPSGHRTLVSSLGNRFMRWILNSPVTDASTKFMALRAEFCRRIRMVGNDQRYVIAIAMARGARRIIEVPIRHQARMRGISKYNRWMKILQGIPEMLAARRRIRQGFYDSEIDADEIASVLRDTTDPAPGRETRT